MKTNQVMVSLPDSYVYDLKLLSQQLGLNKSDIIRRALDDYAKKIKDSK